jgi:pilus assembly protein Flp/PilA
MVPSKVDGYRSKGRAYMFKRFGRFTRDESGVAAIEYGVIASLIALAVITGASTMGTHLSSTFQTIANSL